MQQRGSRAYQGRGDDVRRRQRRILLLEAAGFAVLVAITWADVELILPRVSRSLSAATGSLLISLTETAWILGLGFFVINLQVRNQKRIRVLEGVLSTCSFCKRIEKGGRWIQIEQYVRDNSEAVFSHGLCPDCGVKHYGDLYVRAMGPEAGSGPGPDAGDLRP